jgi:hypothetical protein
MALCLIYSWSSPASSAFPSLATSVLAKAELNQNHLVHVLFPMLTHHVSIEMGLDSMTPRLPRVGTAKALYPGHFHPVIDALRLLFLLVAKACSKDAGPSPCFISGLSRPCLVSAFDRSPRDRRFKELPHGTHSFSCRDGFPDPTFRLYKLGFYPRV